MTAFADLRNGAEYNLDLSQRRADQVATVLSAANPGAVVITRSGGIDAGVTDDLRQARRAEITIG